MTVKEKIKKEIERRYNCEKCYPNDREANIAAAVLQELLLFIYSLPEEPTVKGITWEDVNTLESLIYQVHNEYPSIGEKSFGLEVLERFQGCQDDVEEHNEDLKEEIENWIKTKHFVFTEIEEIIETARHFAEWQRQKDQEKPVSEDLEEASWKYSDRDGIGYGQRYAMQIDFKAGAEWQKNQLTKDAILETKVIMDCDGDGIETPYEEWLTLEDTEIPYIPDNLGLKEGDKVKIIIVKTEQQ